MKNWTRERLGEVVTHKKGFAFKSESFQASGYPVIKVSNFTANSVCDEALEYVDESTYNDHLKFRVRGGDVVIQTVGSWPNNPESVVGRVIRIPQSLDGALLNQNAVVLYPKSRVHPLFLYYLLQSNNFKGYIINTAQGAANQASITLESIFRFEFYRPAISEQKRIAAILSAYDELIENNRRRVALLEKLAEEIYREWFVRLRFPGHEKVKRTKRVPDGWKVVELKTVCSEVGRSTKAGEHLTGRFYLPLDLLNTKQMLPAGHMSYTEAQSSLVTFEKGDFLFGAMRPYQHKVAIAPFAGITRTTCFVIRPKLQEAWSWLFLTLFQESSVDFATNICNGSDRPYVVWNKAMERMKILRPTDALLKRFEEIARPILDSIVSMYFIQSKLVTARDMLLPRLISGKLSVENLDIQFSPGMTEEMKAIA